MKNAIKMILFCLIFIILFGYVTNVFRCKRISDSWNYTEKIDTFYNAEEDSIQIICVGSSHMYCSVVPSVVEEQTGASAYTLAVQQQPPVASYYYMKEAFKTQHPKYVVFECFSLMLFFKNEPEEAVLYDNITPLRPSVNKLEMIYELTKDRKESKTGYYFSLVKYHSRYYELNKTDFTYKSSEANDEYKGYVYLTAAKPQTKPEFPDEESVTPVAVSGDGQAILAKMQKLCEENGAELVLLLVPFPDCEDRYTQYLGWKQYCEENNYNYIDGWALADKCDFDYDNDFYDGGHMNYYGAEKFTKVFCESLEF